MDGYYDLPAGHLERGESLEECAARELKEETDLEVEPKDLSLAHIFLDEQSPEKTYLAFMFVAEKWSGKPKNMEPERSSDLGFFDLAELPSKTRPHTLEMLKDFTRDSSLKISYFEPGRFS